MRYGARKRQAAAAARAAGFDALLVTHLPDVRWLCGFTGSNAALLLQITAKGSPSARLFTDGRYTAQAKQEAAGTRVTVEPRSALVAACAWLGASPSTRCGFDEGNTTVAAFREMQRSVPASRRRSLFQQVGPLVGKLRWIKDPDEISLMRAAAHLGCNLFERLLTIMQPGMAETAVAAELEHAARIAGAERMSFDTIVASGERSSLPHGRATGAKLPRRGFCTLDFGVVLDGYCSDMTRTVHLGRASTGEREAYDAVLAAQEAGVATVREGVDASDVDEAARSVLRQAGLDKWFTHSTGHGLGLEIHEGPALRKKTVSTAKTSAGKKKPASTEKESAQLATPPVTLKAGMVITIEPGVYMPGKFGVRIEDTVLVTRTGCEILTPCTKAWIEL